MQALLAWAKEQSALPGSLLDGQSAGLHAGAVAGTDALRR